MPPTVDRYTIDRYIDRYVGRYSTDTRSILGQVSADSVGRYSTDTRPSIDRVSTDISVDISADSIGRYLADTTFSTHDPTSAMISKILNMSTHTHVRDLLNLKSNHAGTFEFQMYFYFIHKVPNHTSKNTTGKRNHKMCTILIMKFWLSFHEKAAQLNGYISHQLLFVTASGHQ